MTEEAENRFPVMPLLLVVGVILIAVVGIVLHHKEAIGRQQAVLEDQVRNTVNDRQTIRRAGKNVVVLLPIQGHEFKYVTVNDPDLIFDLQLFCCFLYEFDAARKLIYIRHITAASGDKLVAVVARAAKEIKHPEGFKIKGIVQNIKQTFLSEVCRRPGRPVFCRWVKTPPFEGSSYNPHK